MFKVKEPGKHKEHCQEEEIGPKIQNKRFVHKSSHTDNFADTYQNDICQNDQFKPFNSLRTEKRAKFQDFYRYSFLLFAFSFD